MRISAPVALILSKSCSLPGTRNISPKEHKIRLGKLARAMA